jgi:WD40 repeat protein
MNAVAYSIDGNSIAAGGRNGMIRIWDSRSGAVQTEFPAQRTRIRSIEYTDEGRVVSCGDDCIVKITDPSDVAGALELPRMNGKAYSAKLLSDNRLATGGSDDLIHIWDLKRLERIESLVGHTGTISCLDYSGTILASGSYDTQVRIWESRPRAAAIEPPRELDLNESLKQITR